MWMTLPNLLTLCRIAIIPVIVTLIWPGIESRHTCFWAMVLYAIAGVTDVVDGLVARRYGQVTVLGKFLDPLSDKLIYLTTLVALLQLQGPRVPPWLVMIVVGRELSITGLRAIAISEGVVIDAKEGGKLKTFLGTIGMCGLLVHYPYLVNYGPVATIVNFHVAGLWVTFLSVVFSVASGIDYMRGFVRAIRARSPRTT
jgi:CDP-diacylglycerol--glycerol-3-phosphate 3-phosphatidyltransferase